jgi:membrane peptidoglycan carboxypeptidase
VKNVLLAHEKTLSRKMQELFLVWYLEQLLPKQRILELYFNAIEFGPRLYGIGPAARHYFGKSASDLGPLEAAFFSSILPSPKRRYVQYCAGALNAKWDKYVRRIMAKTHERGRLSDEEYDAAQMTPFAFNTAERGLTEKQCMDWVKQITATPQPEPEPSEAESP